MILLFTSAIITEKYDMRMKEYSDSLQQLKEYGIRPKIVECVASSFPIDGEDVIYPGVNNPGLRNKGVNEAKALLTALRQIKAPEGEKVAKLTGRYLVESRNTFDMIDSTNYDAYVRYDNHGQVFTGMFAMKYSHLVRFLETIDYDGMENNMQNFEWLTAKYISDNKLSVYKFDRLHVKANIFGTGVCNLTHW